MNEGSTSSAGPRLLGPADVRALAERYDVRPTKQRGQNFVIDANTVRRIARAADLEPKDVVLEVGTGSGYQAAVLSHLVRHVYTIEIVKPLAAQAAERLAALEYANVTVRQGDGYAGWPERGPFDAIMVTAGADHIPEPLIAQLKPGGRLVMPVGRTSISQQLILLEKDRQGRVRKQQLLSVAFVPLTGRAQE